MQDKIFVRAAIAPRRLGSPSVSLLIEALNENDPKIRWVTLPGQIGLPAIPSLTEALKDRNGTMQEGATSAVGQIATNF
jgi:hypothetical protein